MRMKLDRSAGLVPGHEHSNLSLKSKGITRVAPCSCNVCKKSALATGGIVPCPSGFTAGVYSRYWESFVNLPKVSSFITSPVEYIEPISCYRSSTHSIIGNWRRDSNTPTDR